MTGMAGKPSKSGKADQSGKVDQSGKANDGSRAARRTGGLVGRVCTALSPRYLSLGLIWSWMTCAWVAEPVAHGLGSVDGIAIFSGEAWLPSAALVVVGLFLLPLFARSRSRLPLWAVVACAAACAVGTFLRLVLPVGAPTAWGLGILTGMGSAGLLIGSAGLLSELDTERLEAVMPANGLVSAFCSLLVSAMEPLATVVFSSLLPALAGALLVRAMTAGDLADAAFDALPATPGAGPAAGPGLLANQGLLVNPGTTVAAVLTNLVAFLAVCFLESKLPVSLAEQSDPWVSLVIGAASLAIVVLVIGNTVRVDATGLYRWVLPLVICCLALSLLGSEAFDAATYFIGEVCDYSLLVLLGVYFITLAHRGVLSGCAAAGLCYGSCQLGVLLGNLLAVASRGSFEADLACTVGCICLLAAMSALLPWISGRRKPTVAAAGVPGAVCRAVAAGGVAAHAGVAAGSGGGACDGVALAVGAAGAAGAAGGQNLPGDSGALDAACSRVAEACGLSARELEVLGYLARGRTQPYIREALLLSKNTVSSHVQHIYTKLGVHSKQELIDLVEDGRLG